jgi:hypothetical protein
LQVCAVHVSTSVSGRCQLSHFRYFGGAYPAEGKRCRRPFANGLTAFHTQPAAYDNKHRVSSHNFISLQIIINKPAMKLPNAEDPEVYNNSKNTSNLLPKKMEQIECSETSAIINQTPGNHPKEDILYSKHGESLKSRILQFC